MPRNVYLALGDSVSMGQGASHPNLSFVRYVTDFLKAKSLTERTVVIAQPGVTAKQVSQAATMVSPKLWDEVGVATLCMGTSDLARLLRPRRLSLDGNPFPPRSVLKRADEFGFHTDQLFKLVHEKKIPHVLATTLYNPFPHFAPACQFVEVMNSIIHDCASYYKFTMVEVDKAFKDNEAYYIQGYRTGDVMDLMTPLRKPLLPNNAGHRAIAALVTTSLSRRLADAEKATKGRPVPDRNGRRTAVKSRKPR